MINCIFYALVLLVAGRRATFRRVGLFLTGFFAAGFLRRRRVAPPVVTGIFLLRLKTDCNNKNVIYILYE
jgi:hypothetical protein